MAESASPRLLTALMRAGRMVNLAQETRAAGMKLPLTRERASLQLRGATNLVELMEGEGRAPLT